MWCAHFMQVLEGDGTGGTMAKNLEHEESILELRRQVLFETLDRDLKLTREARAKAQHLASLALAVGVNTIAYYQTR